MNNEIKEILDNVKKCCDITKEQSFTVYQRQDILKLLDYITNLQDTLKDREEYCYGLETQLTNLQEENKNLTHIVANKIIEDYDIDTPLKNQLNEERIKYINLGVVCNDYKSRNEKAIEYIRNHQLVFELSSKKQIQDWFDMFYKDSINILNGGDE